MVIHKLQNFQVSPDMKTERSPGGLQIAKIDVSQRKVKSLSAKVFPDFNLSMWLYQLVSPSKLALHSVLGWCLWLAL